MWGGERDERRGVREAGAGRKGEGDGGELEDGGRGFVGGLEERLEGING